jgi:hypothetical protein
LGFHDDLVLVAEIAGHKRLETTRIVADSATKEVRRYVEVPSCRAQATQKVEFLQRRQTAGGHRRVRAVGAPARKAGQRTGEIK